MYLRLLDFLWGRTIVVGCVSSTSGGDGRFVCFNFFSNYPSDEDGFDSKYDCRITTAASES